jgi:hypothetical protein
MRPATRSPPLFSPGEAQSQAYINLRDANAADAAAGREFVEQLWDRYFSFADEHFLTEIRRDFHARFWEMYLTCALIEAAATGSYRVSCPKPGPDNLIERDGRRIWVEAVTATPGNPSKPDSLVARIDGQMSIVPADKIVLRYSNAIAEKYAKYRGYLDSGIVDAKDSFVVAVNGWSLDYSWASGELPRFLKAIFPLGAMGYAIDSRTKEIVDRNHQFRPIIHKTNRAPISTELFVSEHCIGISAVLHSDAHAFMTQPLGADFQVAHNPLATQPVAARLIPSWREWRATAKEGGGYELAWCGGSLSSHSS